MRTIVGIRMDNVDPKTNKPMTQERFAEKIGVPISTYQRYERYEVPIPTPVLIKIADTVGIVDVREIKYL